MNTQTLLKRKTEYFFSDIHSFYPIYDTTIKLLYIEKLWTVVPKMDMNICHIFQNQYVDMFIHATVSCSHTVELRDMFWFDIVENFNLELYEELAGLDSDQLYAILIGKDRLQS